MLGSSDFIDFARRNLCSILAGFHGVLAGWLAGWLAECLAGVWGLRTDRNEILLSCWGPGFGDRSKRDPVPAIPAVCYFADFH